MSERENIESVVHAGLCTGCGTCVAICPKGVVCMEETPSGLLFAKVSTESCNACGLCLRVCGGWHLAPGLLPVNVDPFKGEVIAAYCGHATNPEIRLRGQSGGVVTALLSFLLESGRIDQALVNRMPEDGTLRPKPFLSSSNQELLQSQGSKYCPVALNTAIPGNVGKNGKKLAIVGLPCHLHSLRNAQQFDRHWKEGVDLTIGLFCERTLAYGAIDYLIEKGNSATENVSAFRFKDKTQGGWPGSIYIRTKGGKEIIVPSRERHVVKDYFTPLRCRLCFDKINVLSDIAVGDAWGVNEDKVGVSVMIARTASGLDLLKDTQKAGYLTFDQIDPEKIFCGQDVEARRRRWSAFTKVRQKLKGQLPDCGINSKFIDKNTTSIEDVTQEQYRWADIYFSGKTSAQIVKTVKKRQRNLRIKNNLKWIFYDRWI